MTRITRITFLIAGSLIVYGYLCRAIGLYFFWESKYIGWNVFFIGVIGLLFTRIKIIASQNRKGLIEKIGVGIVIFGLMLELGFIITIHNAKAYQISREFLLNNKTLISEIGDIKGFSLIPIGIIEKGSSSFDESGKATIHLTVKGKKMFKDMVVYVEKEQGLEWKVIDPERDKTD